MLNPDLNLVPIAERYANQQRVRINHFFNLENCEALDKCLKLEVPWGLASIKNGQGNARDAAYLSRMTADDWKNYLAYIQKTAREEFQYLYNSYMMVTAYKERRDPNLFLHRVFEFLNSEGLLQLVRDITGDEQIRKADAQATRYLPGHFLKRHNDYFEAAANDSRRVAYVINMTEKWEADWGGLLQFMDDNGNIEETWIPTYNSLNLFKVPTWHCVSCVAPYATRPRLSITGWFRTH